MIFFSVFTIALMSKHSWQNGTSKLPSLEFLPFSVDLVKMYNTYVNTLWEVLVCLSEWVLIAWRVFLILVMNNSRGSSIMVRCFDDFWNMIPQLDTFHKNGMKLQIGQKTYIIRAWCRERFRSAFDCSLRKKICKGKQSKSQILNQASPTYWP